MAKDKFSPREYLKSRRPERFSDSLKHETPTIHRSMLEFHLDSLNSRNQANEFERFARRLAELEICPNLTAHTGPDAGGDSKADTETYPVSELLTEAWFWGWGNSAASQRWAFAISAKKDWKTKVKSDVKKLSETERGYEKIFYMSNQAIRDKERSAMEDTLRNKHSLDVRILDRTWILDKVFSNGHQKLAMDELLLSGIATEHVVGPEDSIRQRDLEEIDKHIHESLASSKFDLLLVRRCLKSADLARRLERSREDIDGRYLRAQRIAQRCGTHQQQVEALYEHAWTTFFWHEDAPAMSELYDKVELLALISDNVYDLELLSNLRSLLSIASHKNLLSETDAQLRARTERLTSRLAEMELDVERPSSSLQSRSLRLMIRLTQPGEVNQQLLTEFSQLIADSDNLIGFPLDPISEALTELGPALGEVSGYDELYATLVDVCARRTGEVKTAQMLVRRGKQQLQARRFADAVRMFGRALSLLFKHESRYALAYTLFLCGIAYENLGLLWAARGANLNAVCLSLDELWRYSDVTYNQISSVRRMKWLELRLGRVPHALSWYCMERRLVSLGGVEMEKPSDDKLPDSVLFDSCLGILMLRSSLTQLGDLGLIPSTLDRLELSRACTALRYALGDPDVEGDLAQQMDNDQGKSDEVAAFFGAWLQQPAANLLPTEPSYYQSGTATLSGVVLGCRVTVTSPIDGPGVEIAESILSGVEGLLSVGLIDGVFPLEPHLTIVISIVPGMEAGISYDVRLLKGRPHIDVSATRFNSFHTSLELREKVLDVISKIVIAITAHAFMVKGLETVVVPWFRDDNAMTRAVGATASIGILAAAFGERGGASDDLCGYRSRIQEWQSSGEEHYPLLRSTKWNEQAAEPQSQTRAKIRPAPEEGEPPPEIGLNASTSHSDISVHSLIRVALWDRAGWEGVAFTQEHVGGAVLPVMALVFRDGDVASEIFAHLREDIGNAGSANSLRVLVVRGVDRSFPHNYRVGVGTDLYSLASLDGSHHVFINRFREMGPTSDQNLLMFLKLYEHHKCFVLTWAIQIDDSVDIRVDHGILKESLVVRWAYEIGRHDPDAGAINEDDDVIIPSSVQNAPVHDLLAFKRMR